MLDDQDTVAPDVITMGSDVRLIDVDSGEIKVSKRARILLFAEGLIARIAGLPQPKAQVAAGRAGAAREGDVSRVVSGFSGDKWLLQREGIGVYRL